MLERKLRDGQANRSTYPIFRKKLKDLDKATIELTIHNGIVTQLSKKESSLFASEKHNDIKQVTHLT